ncbi:MAG: tyrosine-type recombinase/integrase [Methanobacterium sp.]
MTYSIDDITKDPLVQDYFNREISESSLKKYRTILKHYCNWRGQLPSDFIEEADIEQNKNIKLKKRKVKRDLIDYIQFLKEENKAPKTINSYMACVKALYYDNDIVLPPRLPTGVGKDTLIKRGHDELPTLDDIRAICNIAPPRDKAIILLQLSSGLGASEVRHLIYEDFIKALKLPVNKSVNVDRDIERLQDREDEELIGCWNIFRYKTGWLFYTFNSPESTKAIIDYLEWRFRNNKPIESYKDSLYVSNFNQQLEDSTLSLIYERLNDKAGYGKRVTNQFRFITSHQVREIFSSSLYRCKVDKTRIDYFLGHKINNQDSAYFRVNPEDLKKEYMKVLPAITLEKVKVKRFTSPEVKEIINELHKKDAEMNEIREAFKMVKPVLDAYKNSPEVRDAINQYQNKNP